MNTEQLKEAHDLLEKIEQMETHIASFKEAERITVAATIKQRSLYFTRPSVELTPSEIADDIVRVLERRIAAWKAHLDELGVDR